MVSKARGYVDADIEFDQKGNIKQVRIVKSEPQNPAFEKAVLDVTKLWLFNAVLTKDCVPVDSTGNVRTWFEVRDGKGVVSVSGNVSAASSPANSVPRKSDWENRKDFALSLKYPTNALRGRVQTDLLAAIRVDAASGVPSDVVVTWIETSGNATPTVVEEIKTAVARSLKRARFTPRAGEAYRVCVPFNFRVS
ncbi:MAG: energy transducer TonB [Burkholderiales bacterium]|nr:energy transducer TonB [Burkholderiales bacterium]